MSKRFSTPTKMGKKNPFAVNLGRLGGKARAAHLTAAERSESASNAAASRWATMTPAQRSAEMKRRANKRKNKAQKKETLP